MIQYQRAAFGGDPAQFSADAQAFLNQKYLGDPALADRLEVQKRFQNEPAGVLSVELP
jgi:hypothetical protein